MSITVIPQCINLNPFIGQQTSGESYHQPADLKGMIRRVLVVSPKLVNGEKVGRPRVKTTPIRDEQRNYDLKGEFKSLATKTIKKVSIAYLGEKTITIVQDPANHPSHEELQCLHVPATDDMNKDECRSKHNSIVVQSRCDFGPERLEVPS